MEPPEVRLQSRLLLTAASALDQSRMLRAASLWSLKASKDGDHAASPSNQLSSE